MWGIHLRIGKILCGLLTYQKLPQRIIDPLDPVVTSRGYSPFQTSKKKTEVKVRPLLVWPKSGLILIQIGKTISWLVAEQGEQGYSIQVLTIGNSIITGKYMKLYKRLKPLNYTETETTKLYKCIKLLNHIRNWNHLAIHNKRGYHKPIHTKVWNQ